MSRLSIAVGIRRMWMSFARGSFLYLRVGVILYELRIKGTNADFILQIPHIWTTQALRCMPTR